MGGATKIVLRGVPFEVWHSQTQPPFPWPCTKRALIFSQEVHSHAQPPLGLAREEVIPEGLLQRHCTPALGVHLEQNRIEARRRRTAATHVGESEKKVPSLVGFYTANLYDCRFCGLRREEEGV